MRRLAAGFGALPMMSPERVEAGMRLISQALSSTSLEELASAIGKDDSQASRIRSGQMGATVQDVARMLYAAGLKVVTADRVCVHRPTYQAMATIAARAMANEEFAQRLVWEDLQ